MPQPDGYSVALLEQSWFCCASSTTFTIPKTSNAGRINAANSRNATKKIVSGNLTIKVNPRAISENSKGVPEPFEVFEQLMIPSVRIMHSRRSQNESSILRTKHRAAQFDTARSRSMNSQKTSFRNFRLADGTPVRTRPITPADADALTRGLRRLSPEGNAYRFLHHRSRFTEKELHYLTHCDFVDHIAVVLSILDANGNEVDTVGVARSIRTSSDRETAEVAVVLVDEWQKLGGGKALLRHLANLTWQQGVHRWVALMHDHNVAGARLLERFGRTISRRTVAEGTIETVYALNEPSPFEGPRSDD